MIKINQINMELLITDINWLAVIVGAVVAYMLGAFWYSEKLFLKRWKVGLGTPAVPNMPMMPGMLSQAVGTFLLSWLIGFCEKIGSVALMVLVALTISVLIKANGFFGGKSKYAIFVEASFVLVMVVVMVVAHMVF